MFVDELKSWIDSDGLLGTSLNPSKWSGGNQLLDTWTAVILLRDTNNLTKDLKDTFCNATRQCQIKLGIFNKNPGRPDQITHDDLLGVSSGSAYIQAGFEDSLVIFGTTNDWIMSNTGEKYWDAIAKPWHRGSYKLAAGVAPSLLELFALCGSYIADAFSSDASGAKLMWVQSKALKGKSKLCDLAIRFWEKRLLKKFGSIKNLLAEYYGKDHILVKLCQY